MLRLFASVALALSTHGVTAPAYADDWRLKVIQSIPARIEADEASKVELCSRQSDRNIKAACEASWDVIKGEHASLLPQLQAMIAFGGLVPGHEKLKNDLGQIVSEKDYDAFIDRMTDKMKLLREKFKVDQAKAAAR
jgi:hypothetical protein